MTLTQRKTIPPNYASVIGMLNLVRAQAEMRKIEDQLKHDPNVGFRLLRYVNSPGIGLATEVRSFRAAVQVLGYTQLYKWLSVVLVTSVRSIAGAREAKAAVTFARTMELLGQQARRTPEQQDDLFLLGVFSRLESVLGIPLHQIIEQLRLPEPLAAALNGRPGPYRSFLDVAKACEEEDFATAADLADPFGIGREQIGEIVEAAQSWAEQIRY